MGRAYRSRCEGELALDSIAWYETTALCRDVIWRSIASAAQSCRSVEVAAAVEARLLKPTGAMHDWESTCRERLSGLDMRGAASAGHMYCNDVLAFARSMHSHDFAPRIPQAFACARERQRRT